MTAVVPGLEALPLKKSRGSSEVRQLPPRFLFFLDPKSFRISASATIVPFSNTLRV